jgi:hypothetical protein
LQLARQWKVLVEILALLSEPEILASVARLPSLLVRVQRMSKLEAQFVLPAVWAAVLTRATVATVAVWQSPVVQVWAKVQHRKEETLNCMVAKLLQRLEAASSLRVERAWQHQAG